MSPKQARFVEEYLIDLNATQAAIRAGYSPKSAATTGSRLLAEPDVAYAIEEAKEARSERTAISQDRVLKELESMAFANLSDFVRWGDEGMEIKDSETLDAQSHAAIVEVSMTASSTGSRVKIRQGDKLKALELLGKHLGLFAGSEKIEPNNAMEGLKDDELEAEIARLERETSASLERKA